MYSRGILLALACALLAPATMGPSVNAMPNVNAINQVMEQLASKLDLHDPAMARLQKIKHQLRSGSLSREDHPDIDSPTPDMIARRGYPVEIHHVTTLDGYILEMHRIPNPGKPVVFLQHGLLCASSDWVMMGPEKGLAYIMFDAGYDVWMGNARGNTYSRNHTFLDPDANKSEFWAFTWHQMGVYDVPAEIDYVLAKTGESQVIYMGHSMGTTMFFVMCSEVPSYNLKIKQMHALAPVAFMSNMKSPLRLLAPFVNQIEWVTNMMGLDEFMPSSDFMNFIGQTFCNDESLFQIVCTNVLFLICGYDSDQLNETTLPVIMSHTPAGASTKTLLHYAQEVNSANFEYYDFGYIQNENKYGTHDPPDYDLSLISAPVYLHYSNNDWMAHQDDVFQLYGLLPNAKGSFRVPYDKFNHLDFLWAIDVKPLLYDTILALVVNPLP